MFIFLHVIDCRCRMETLEEPQGHVSGQTGLCEVTGRGSMQSSLWAESTWIIRVIRLLTCLAFPSIHHPLTYLRTNLKVRRGSMLPALLYSGPNFLENSSGKGTHLWKGSHSPPGRKFPNLPTHHCFSPLWPIPLPPSGSPVVF